MREWLLEVGACREYAVIMVWQQQQHCRQLLSFSLSLVACDAACCLLRLWGGAVSTSKGNRLIHWLTRLNLAYLSHRIRLSRLRSFRAD